MATAKDRLDELGAAEDACTRCPIHANATQAVPGEGAATARLILVGEQPGDQEDFAGRPFVGPAGKLLDRALGAANVDRKEVYITNAVKHFKFTPRGKRRIHRKPNAGEIDICRWWLDQELEIVKPVAVLAMGATAVRSLMKRGVPISRIRGQVQHMEAGYDLLATTHPSYLLRLRSPRRQQEEEAFVKDVALAWRYAARA